MEGKNLSLNDFSSISHNQESNLTNTEKIQAITITSPHSNNENEKKFTLKVDTHIEPEKGKWTREENRKFIVAILTYGNNWKKVQQFIKTRSCSQARSHAQKFLKKLKRLNIFDCKVTSSLSSISNLQEYIKSLDNEEKEVFTSFLNDLLYKQDISVLSGFKKEFLNKKDIGIINNIQSNIPVISPEKNFTYFSHPNHLYYPSCNYMPINCFTVNTPYNQSLYSPHLNNYNYYGYNMNIFNPTETYHQSYFADSIPMCQAACYALVHENGQYIYKLIPNIYGMFYPYQRNECCDQPIHLKDFQETIKYDKDNDRIESSNKCLRSKKVTIYRKFQKKRIYFKKKEKNIDKHKKKDYGNLCKNENTSNHVNSYSSYTKNLNIMNRIKCNSSHCSEPFKKEFIDYFSSRERSEPIDELNKLESFLDKQCDTENHSIDNSIIVDKFTFPKEMEKISTQSNEYKKEDLLDYFNPSY